MADDVTEGLSRLELAEVTCAGCGIAQPEGKGKKFQQCPTCLKMGLHDTFFHSKDCFKESWPKHKAVHVEEFFDPWAVSKAYTGSLRARYKTKKEPV